MLLPTRAYLSLTFISFTAKFRLDALHSLVAAANDIVLVEDDVCFFTTIIIKPNTCVFARFVQEHSETTRLILFSEIA
jgi:hypothetical protein